MDDFGIGAAAQGALRAILQASRATGRTTRLLERYQDGDRVVFASEQAAQEFARLLREHGKSPLDYHVIDPRDPQQLFSMPRGTPRGRMHFDHTWLEIYYDLQIMRAMKEIRYLQDETSGHGQPHRATREQAEMIARYGGFPEPGISRRRS